MSETEKDKHKHTPVHYGHTEDIKDRREHRKKSI